MRNEFPLAIFQESFYFARLDGIRGCNPLPELGNGVLAGAGPTLCLFEGATAGFLGATATLPKSEAPAQLLKTVNNLLRKQPPVDDKSL